MEWPTDQELAEFQRGMRIKSPPGEDALRERRARKNALEGERKRRNAKPRMCIECGAVEISYGSRFKTCSDACRAARKRRATLAEYYRNGGNEREKRRRARTGYKPPSRAKPPHQVICLCGAELWVTGCQKHCSARCASRAWRERQPPRLCACGAPLEKKRQYCDECLSARARERVRYKHRKENMSPEAWERRKARRRRWRKTPAGREHERGRDRNRITIQAGGVVIAKKRISDSATRAAIIEKLADKRATMRDDYRSFAESLY